MAGDLRLLKAIARLIDQGLLRIIVSFRLMRPQSTQGSQLSRLVVDVGGRLNRFPQDGLRPILLLERPRAKTMMTGGTATPNMRR
jgi:hypothetical protein